MELCQSLHAIYPLSPGCLLKLNEEIQEPLTFRSTAPLIVRRMFWFNFINREKVKSKFAVWKAIMALLTGAFILGKGPPLIVWVHRVPTIYCTSYLSCKQNSGPHTWKWFGPKATDVWTTLVHDDSVHVHCYSFVCCLGDVWPPVFVR